MLGVPVGMWIERGAGGQRCGQTVGRPYGCPRAVHALSTGGARPEGQSTFPRAGCTTPGVYARERQKNDVVSASSGASRATRFLLRTHPEPVGCRSLALLICSGRGVVGEAVGSLRSYSASEGRRRHHRII